MKILNFATFLLLSSSELNFTYANDGDIPKLSTVSFESEVKYTSDGVMIQTVETGAGRQKRMNVRVTTMSNMLALYSDFCGACQGDKVDNNLGSDRTGVATMYNYLDRWNQDRIDLIRQEVFGKIKRDNLKYWVTEDRHHQDILFDYQFIENANPMFEKNEYNGIFGLGPFKGSRYNSKAHKRFNIVDQLNYKDQIQYDIFSISLNKDPKSSEPETIKYGSWDEVRALGAKNPRTNVNQKMLKMFKLTQDSAWKICTSKLKIGHDLIGNFQPTPPNRYLQLDPSYPYHQVPEQDFLKLSQIINDQYGETICNDGRCKLDMPCDQVEMLSKWTLHAELVNAYVGGVASISNTYDIELPPQMIPGDKIGQSSNTCYLPYFMQKEIGDTWILGQPFFRNFYTIFDMTNSNFETEYRQKLPDQYLNIAISVENPDFTNEPEEIIDDHKDEEKDQEDVKEDKEDKQEIEEGLDDGEITNPPIDDGPSFVELMKDFWYNWVVFYVEAYPIYAIIIGSATLLFIIMLCVCCCICRRNKRRNENRRKATDILENLEKEFRLEDSIVDQKQEQFLSNDSLLMTPKSNSSDTITNELNDSENNNNDGINHQQF